MSVKYQFSKDVTIPYVLRELKHLTFPPFERKIASSNITEPLLCIQATNEHNDVVGATLAESNPSKPFAEILSLYVRPDYQNQGIGKRLLEMIRIAALSNNHQEVRLFYRSNWNTKDKIQHILHVLNWSEPNPIMQIYRSNIREFANVRWPLLMDLPPDFSISLWVDMTDADKEFISKKMQEEKTDPYLSPLTNTRNIERSNSLILRFKESPAGWLVTYRNGVDSLEYNNLHIFQSHRKNLRIPMLLLNKAVSLQLEQNIPECIWVIGKHHKRMILYIERYFGKAILEKVDVVMSFSVK